MIHKIQILIKILNKKQKIAFSFVLLFMISSSFLEIISIVVLLDFVNFFIVSESSNRVGIVTKVVEILNINFDLTSIQPRGFIAIFFLVLSSSFSLITVYLTSKFSNKTGGEFESRLFDYYLRRNYLLHIETTSSKLLNNILELVKRVTFFVLNPCLVILSKVIFLLPLLIGLILLQPKITLIACVIFISVYFIIFRIVSSKLTTLGKEESRITKEKFQILQEGFGGFKENKILNKFKYFKSNFKRIYLSFVDIIVWRDLVGRSPKLFIEGLSFSAIILLLIYLSQKLDYNLNEIIFSLAFFVVCSYKIIPAFQQIYIHFIMIKNHIPALNQISPDLFEALKLRDNIKNYKITEKFSNFKKININNLKFNYNNKSLPTIENITLEISRGEKIAITGLSGSGKTTLIHILAGLIEQTSGSISIDGKRLNNNELSSWQKIIGFVPQTIFLTEKTIRENIAFGEETYNIDQNKINKALEISMLSETISHLPKKRQYSHW